MKPTLDVEHLAEASGNTTEMLTTLLSENVLKLLDSTPNNKLVFQKYTLEDLNSLYISSLPLKEKLKARAWFNKLNVLEKLSNKLLKREQTTLSALRL